MRVIPLLDRIWYAGHPLRWLLWPLSWLFIALAAVRRSAYRVGLLKTYRAAVPVIVVGNISVGGTGKTPFTIALCERLQQQGWKPGIVSRGYGGHSEHYPLPVTAGSDPGKVGDEPLLLAQRSSCPMRVDPIRSRAVAALCNEEDIDIVISDDGLQHYALQRDMEIVIVDAQRQHGNGMRLPAGPLRESPRRLEQATAVLFNGATEAVAGFKLGIEDMVNLASGERAAIQTLQSQSMHAIAGIGNPQRFFQTLRDLGLSPTEHAFDDHYAFTAADLDFADQQPVLMTEKDAVKCRAFAQAHHWYLPVTAELNAQAETVMDQLMESLRISFRNS
ncbi:MAG: tetraacyldisaccharide 4'-kinase [Nevskiales bacterium]